MFWFPTSRWLVSSARYLSVLSVVAACGLLAAWSNGSFTAPTGIYQRNDTTGFVKEDVLELQALAGIRRWRFEYHLPRGHMLFVALKAELDGQPQAEMSTEFQVVPELADVPTSGLVVVRCREGGALTDAEPRPNWSFHVSNSGGRRRWLGSSQFGASNGTNFLATYVRGSTSKGSGQKGKSIPSLADLQAHDVWEVTDHWLEAGEDGRSIQREFRYQLTVRAKPIPSDARLGVIESISQAD